jgi:phytoene synthase
MSSAESPLQHAELILATKGRTFHWAKRLLGRCHGERAARLYAFCRYLDDLADEEASAEAAREHLDFAAEAIRRGQASDPVLADALALMRECSIEPAVPLELIAGLQQDLGAVRVATETELLRYCYRVAGTVGLMMSDLLDATDPAAAPFAIDLGIGMQLTNICRDVREDALRGRCYLPQSLIGTVPLATLAAPSATEQVGLRAAIAHLLAIADQYYASGERGLSFLPLRARHGILVAARAYRQIGVRLRAHRCDAWTGRVVVSGLGKLGLTLRALGGTGFDQGFWRRPDSHDAALHRALRGLPRVH